ncbi:hypothetical protein [Desulfitispora alkaliphila]|uniref:Nif3-like dinuclear metal center hexameric protein n=1 Tax=Desulfitispora alkaliphila TaxID=622674 RepID=UPI003D1E7334
MNTEQLLQEAIELAGMDKIPEDSGVLVPGENIKRVLMGVDMEAAEILIAKQLGYDAVITHHPKGGAPMLNLHQVMEGQIQRMVEAGVPINKAQKVLSKRIDEVDRGLHVANYDRAVSAAKLLEMPFIAIHSPADVLAERLVQNHLDQRLEKKPEAKLSDVVKALKEIPEYNNALTEPKIRVGSEKSYAGKVFVTMAGGTGGGEKVAEAYFDAGVGTLIAMHMPEKVISAVKKQNIGNVIIAGHMASDSVGLNQIIEHFNKMGIEVGRASGIVEV